MAQFNPRNPDADPENLPPEQKKRRLSDIPDDLSDSPSDQERLQDESSTIELPELSDIPGQENINVPPLGELADTTISSADEEDLVNDDSDSLDEPEQEGL